MTGNPPGINQTSTDFLHCTHSLCPSDHLILKLFASLCAVHSSGSKEIILSFYVKYKITAILRCKKAFSAFAKCVGCGLETIYPLEQ